MTESDSIHLLSVMALACNDLRAEAGHCLDDLDEEQADALVALASKHHVLIRGLEREEAGSGRFSRLISTERRRAQYAAKRLWEVCRVLEQNDCPVVVIKSFDHWPDFGTDLDLLTRANKGRVAQVLRREFGASIETPTWADRVARKVNFRLPDLPELIEIHFGRLGQAGEHATLVDRIMERRVAREIDGQPFWIPAPEEQILLATLQRLYRHYYVRICDVVNTAHTVKSGKVNFDELRRAAKRAGVWPGVATYLRLVSGYVKTYGGQHLNLPRRVWLASSFGVEKVYANAGFLRLPLFPQGTSLYARQLVRALRRRDTAGSLRLGLVPPLALAANVKYRATGNEHGIW